MHCSRPYKKIQWLQYEIGSREPPRAAVQIGIAAAFLGFKKNTEKKISQVEYSSCLHASACRLGCHAEGKEDAARGTEAQHVVRRCTTHAQDGSSYAFGYSSRCVPRQKETKGDGAEEATKGDGEILLLHRRQNPFQ